jgi:hypothetical protein
MSNTRTNTETLKLMEKINQLGELKGQTPSSMITLVIPSKYCI